MKRRWLAALLASLVAGCGSAPTTAYTPAEIQFLYGTFAGEPQRSSLMD